MSRMGFYPQREPGEGEYPQDARGGGLKRLALRIIPRKPKRHYDGEIIAGRPYLEAHIPTIDLPRDAEQINEFREKYYHVLQELTYKEAMAWCRAFGYKYATFLARKYQHREAKLEEVILTLYWHKQGKPMKYRKHKYRLPKGDKGDTG